MSSSFITARQFVHLKQKQANENADNYFINEDESDFFKSLNNSWGDELLSFLENRLPLGIKEGLSNGSIVITSIFDKKPNAYVEFLENDEYAVIFQGGLRDFVYRITRVLSSILYKEEGNSISFNEGCKIIADIYWWMVSSDESFGPNYDISPNQIVKANNLALNAESFFLCHELGHIMYKKENNEKESDRKQIEYYADAYAFKIMLGHYSDDEYQLKKIQEIYSGIILGILIFQGIDEIGIKFQNATHPDTEKRLAQIKIKLKEMFQSEQVKLITSEAYKIEQVFTKVVQTIKNPTNVESTYFKEEQNKLYFKLDELLEKCAKSEGFNSGGINISLVSSNAVPPDYATFYSEATNLFAQGSSGLIYSIFDRMAKKLKSDLKNLNEKGTEFDEKATINFKKVKLLIGYTQEAPAPIRNKYSAVMKKYFTGN